MPAVSYDIAVSAATGFHIARLRELLTTKLSVNDTKRTLVRDLLQPTVAAASLKAEFLFRIFVQPARNFNRADIFAAAVVGSALRDENTIPILKLTDIINSLTVSSFTAAPLPVSPYSQLYSYTLLHRFLL